MSEMTPQQIAELASSRAFGTRLITNVLRGLVVEAIVSTALCPEWRWCSEDYFQYDFEHPTGIGLEVKQSAACQSWETKVPSVARWDIAARSHVYEDDKWVGRPGRAAGIHVLAWNPVSDRALADHRDPMQWQFFVVRSSSLSPTKTIGLAGAKRLASAVGISELRQTVSTLLTPQV